MTLLRIRDKISSLFPSQTETVIASVAKQSLLRNKTYFVPGRAWDGNDFRRIRAQAEPGHEKGQTVPLPLFLPPRLAPSLWSTRNDPVSCTSQPASEAGISFAEANDPTGDTRCTCLNPFPGLRSIGNDRIPSPK
jgi:hypothetical protein